MTLVRHHAPPVAPTGPASSPTESELAPGAKIGRYAILERVGEGGMGVVFSAYDPELDRRVAIKLLAPRRIGDEARVRLLREAQAMARLSHPNVVPVYDAGTVGGRVFVAMEFVQGVTLRHWLDRESRPWTDVLDTMRRAALGLHAAHEAGLVHRDFKPDNVMVGDDGRVRVLDFGLARSATLDSVPEPGDGTTAASSPAAVGNQALSARLTSQGAMVGTPAYMPPEQLEGLTVDARADQWSFCSTFYEALYGARPFEASTVAAALLAMHHDAPDPGAKSDVPRWLHDVVARGLAPNPEDRFGSMGELIAAVDNDPARGRRRAAFGVVGVVGALALVGLGAFGSRLGTTPDAPDPCPDPATELAGIWDPQRASEVDAAVRGVDLPYAGHTAERVAANLDDYARAWTRDKLDACEATHVRKEQSGDLLDRRTACLAHSRAALKATVDVFADADHKTVERAAAVVSGLPPLPPCSDSDVLKAEVAPPADPEIAARVDAVDEKLAASLAAANAGRRDEATAAVTAVMPAALAVDYAPTRAEAYRVRGHIRSMRGEYEASEADLRAAYEEALQSGGDRLAAGIAVALVQTAGVDRRRLDVAESWAASARALCRRVDVDSRLHARAITLTGLVRDLRGQHAEAVELFLEAIALLERIDGVASPEFGLASNHLGAAYDQLGRHDEAEVAFRRALAITEDRFGAEHPALGMPLDNLAVNLQAQGRLDEALKLQRRVLTIKTASLSPGHPGIALTRNNVGWTLHDQGKFQDAAVQFEHAMVAFADVLDPEHPRVAMAAEGLATAKMELGVLDEAQRLHLRALEIRREAVGPDHPNVALSHLGLGDVALKRGRSQEALEQFDAAIEILEQHPDDAVKFLADGLHRRGLALLEANRAEDALPDLERANELLDAGAHLDPGRIGDVRFALARALRAAAPDDPRADALARSAKDAYSQAQGADHDAALEQLEALLAGRD